MRSGLRFAFGVLLAASARADPPAPAGPSSAPAVAGSSRESSGDAHASVPSAPSGAAGAVPYGYAPMPQYGWPVPVVQWFDARTLYFDATDSDAVLQVHQRLEDGRLVWRFVCSAPCVTTASLRGEYRVGGPGISNSRTFLVPPRPYPLSVSARTGSNSGRIVGIVLTPLGAVLALVGGVVIGLTGSCYDCTAPEARARQDRAFEEGLPILLLGTGAIVGGILLVTTNRTRLDFTPDPVASAPRLRLGHGFELSARGFQF